MNKQSPAVKNHTQDLSLQKDRKTNWMAFSGDKCKILHVGPWNHLHIYREGSSVKRAEKFHSLEVQISAMWLF